MPAGGLGPSKSLCNLMKGLKTLSLRVSRDLKDPRGHQTVTADFIFYNYSVRNNDYWTTRRKT